MRNCIQTLIYPWVLVVQCRLAGAFATSVDFVHRQQEQYEQHEQKQNAKLLIGKAFAQTHKDVETRLVSYEKDVEPE